MAAMKYISYSPLQSHQMAVLTTCC